MLRGWPGCGAHSGKDRRVTSAARYPEGAGCGVGCCHASRCYWIWRWLGTSVLPSDVRYRAWEGRGCRSFRRRSGKLGRCACCVRPGALRRLASRGDAPGGGCFRGAACGCCSDAASSRRLLQPFLVQHAASLRRLLARSEGRSLRARCGAAGGGARLRLRACCASEVRRSWCVAPGAPRRCRDVGVAFRNAVTCSCGDALGVGAGSGSFDVSLDTNFRNPRTYRLATIERSSAVIFQSHIGGARLRTPAP